MDSLHTYNVTLSEPYGTRELRVPHRPAVRVRHQSKLHRIMDRDEASSSHGVPVYLLACTLVPNFTAW